MVTAAVPATTTTTTTTTGATMHDLYDLGERLAAALPASYARHLGDGVLDAGYTLRKRPGQYGEVRVLLELEVDGDVPSVLVAVLWYDEEGEPVTDEVVAEGLSPDDVAGITTAIDTAIGELPAPPRYAAVLAALGRTGW